MKQIVLIVMIGALALTAGGCKNRPQNQPQGGSEDSPAPVPADNGQLIEIREKMFLAQTNDVYLNPKEYMGKTIKLEGLFKFEKYPGRETPYCFVIRYGPGCCGNDGNAGFEVAWDTQERERPPYPQTDEWVEAAGVLKTYEEDDYPYLYLALSSLKVLNKRGAEFVNQ